MGVRVRGEVKAGFRVNCRVWWDKSCCGESWCQSMCKAIADSILDANFADVFAFEDIIAKNINDGLVGWWSGVERVVVFI